MLKDLYKSKSVSLLACLFRKVQIIVFLWEEPGRCKLEVFKSIKGRERELSSIDTLFQS